MNDVVSATSSDVSALDGKGTGAAESGRCAPTWRRRVLGAAMLVILFAAGTCLTFWCFIGPSSPGKTVTGRFDWYRYFTPFTFFLDHELHYGEFPWWDPVIYCGLPHAAIPQAFLFYPPNLLRGLLVMEPTPHRTFMSMVVLTGVHFIFMAVCLYYCARRHGISPPGSLVASTAFCFGALLIRLACDYLFITTIAWLPLLIILEKTILETNGFRSKARYALIMAFVLGLAVLSGFLQVVQYMGAILVAYGAFHALLFHEPSSSATYRAILCRTAASCAWVGAVVVVASLLAAPLLLSSSELAAYSARLPGSARHRYSDIFAWSAIKFYQSFVVHAGMWFEAETVRGSGVAALLLSLVGLTHARRRSVVLFGFLFLVFLECSFGPPLPFSSILERVTPFSMSAYTRAYIFALFPLSMMAGLGVDALSDPERSKSLVFLRAGILAYVGAAALIPLASWVSPHPYLPVSFMVVAVPAVAIVAAAASLFAARWRRISRAFSGVIVLLVFAETLAWNRYLAPRLSERPTGGVPVDKEGSVAISLENRRGADPTPNRSLLSLEMSMNGYETIYIKGMRDILSGSSRERQQSGLVQNWEVCRENHRGNLFLKRSFWLARQYVVGALPGKHEVFHSATTVFLKQADTLPVARVPRASCVGRSVSDRTTRLDLMKNKGLLEPIKQSGRWSRRLSFSLPRAAPGKPPGTAGAVHSALFLHYRSTRPATVGAWFEEPTRKRSSHGKRCAVRTTAGKEAVIEVPMPDYAAMNAVIVVDVAGTTGTFQFTRAYVLSDNQDEDGLLRITRRSANSVDLEVGPLPDYRLLTFLDAYYPGWHAHVNDEPVEILCADDQFKAILVPPGVSRVRFTYVPARTYCGIGISLTTLVTMVATYGGLACGARRSGACRKACQGG